MSQSPWPEDLYAVARLDWCRAVPTPEGGQVAQLVCNDLARQCGSFTNATRDRQRIARTAPQLQELLKSAEIESWSGKCPVAETQGICGLGGAQGYEAQLWDAFAAPRQQLVYDAIAGLVAPLAGAEADVAAPPVILAPELHPERAVAAAVARLNAAPRRLVNDSQLLGLPFL